MQRRFVLFTIAAIAITSLSAGGQQTSQSAPAQPGAAPPTKPGETVQFQAPAMPELPNDGLGVTDQPLIPGQKWRVRDLNRPRPSVVTPGQYPGQPPSDALVLFEGKDLSQWTVNAFGGRGRGGNTAAPPAAAPSQPAPTVPGWKVENGYMEMVPGTGSLVSKERFKDFQLHIEFAAPPVPVGKSQYRGNSGITIGGREIQILDNYKNDTYADGYVGAIYGQWPPLANPARPPGEWQTMDVAYMAARYEGDRLARNAFITIYLNGVLIHNNREILPTGRGGGRGPGAGPGGTPSAAAGAPGAQNQAAAPGGDQPIGLMAHPSAIPGNAVRYRNIWVRRLDVELHTQQPPPQQD